MIFSHVIKQYERAVVFKLGKVTPDISKASTNGELVPHAHH
jgi:hypothetical protein